MDFWYSIGSTYSYLTVMRLPDLARQRGVDVTWRPFNVRHVMIAQNNIPFKDKPVKAAYMWRDIERRAARFGLAPRVPAPYPIPGLERANRTALVAAREGWAEAYTRATYRRWFEDGQPAGEDPNLSASIFEAGHDPAHVLALADAPETVGRLAEETDTAMQLGVFGAPSFAVGGEVFWGDDRLEDALDWARRA